MQSYGSITITDLTDKSVKSVYAFYKSTSSAQAPAAPTAPQEGATPSGWSTQVTTSSNNPYAWMIIITYYTDGDPYVSQPSQVGNHASSITNVTNEIRYAKGDSSTNPPQTGWKVDPDTTSTTYPYLWTRITPIVTIDSTPSRLAPSYMVSVPIEGISENAVKSTVQLWRTSSTKPVVPTGHQSSRITISTTDYSSGWNPMSPVDSSSGTVVNFSNLWYISETQYLDGTYEYTQPQRDANYHVVNAIGVFKNDLASDSGSTIINGGHITTNSIKAAQIDVDDLTAQITTIGDPTKEHFTISGTALKAYNTNGNQYFSVSADSMTYGNSTNQQTVASQSYAQSQASTAKQDAINTAAADATSKANIAKQDAINTAGSNTDTKLASYTPTTDLSSVALSGNYQDLNNQPAIPSKTSDLTNDSEFQTAEQVGTTVANHHDDTKYDASNPNGYTNDTVANRAEGKADAVTTNLANNYTNTNGMVSAIGTAKSEAITTAAADATAKADIAAQTATKFLVDDNGVTLWSPTNHNNKILLNNAGMTIYKDSGGTASASVDIANFGSNIRIGENSTSRFLIEADSLMAYGVQNNLYFSVSANGITYGNNIQVAKDSDVNGILGYTDGTHDVYKRDNNTFYYINENGVEQNIDETALNHIITIGDQTYDLFYDETLHKYKYMTDSGEQLVEPTDPRISLVEHIFGGKANESSLKDEIARATSAEQDINSIVTGTITYIYGDIDTVYQKEDGTFYYIDENGVEHDVEETDLKHTITIGDQTYDLIYDEDIGKYKYTTDEGEQLVDPNNPNISLEEKITGGKADNSVVNTLQQVQDNIAKYITISDNGIQIGQKTTTEKGEIQALTIQIDSSEIGFYDGEINTDNKVAWIYNGLNDQDSIMHIENAEIQESQRIGEYIWKKREGGRLTLMYSPTT